LVRQLLSESFVIAFVGAAIGVGLAIVIVPVLIAAFPGTLPGREFVGVRWPELSVAVLAAFSTSLLFGVLPALIASRSARVSGQHASVGRAGSTRTAQLVRSSLIATEVTITLALVAGSLLLIRSFATLTSQETGFSSRDVTTAYLQIPAARFPKDADRRLVFQTLRDRLSENPNVIAAATTFPLAFDGASMGSAQRWDPALGITTPLSFSRRYVSNGYLDAMSVRLLRGRFFGDQDRADSPLVAVVNESFAKRYGQTRDVIGMRFVTGDAMTTIIGVVADIRSTYVRVTGSELMFPMSQSGLVMGSFIIRSEAPPAAIGELFRTVLREQYPFLPAGNIQPLASVIHSSVSQQRFNMSLLSVLAALALGLSVVGIYGVMAYVVSQRRREMAIRMALGAEPRRVRTLSVRQGMTPVVVGVAGGLIGAWFFTTLLKKELFQITPHDPWSFAAAAALFLAVGLTACWLPARRSARVDPVEVLRAD
jgi:predicted permease